MNGVIKIPRATPTTENPNKKPDATVVATHKGTLKYLSLIHISEPTRP